MSDYAASTESDRDLERCRRLVDASYALHTTLDLDELLGLILDTAKAGVDADRGTVFLISADGTALWSRVITGAENLEIRLPMGQGIAGSVAQTGATVRLADAHSDDRFDASWDRQSGYVTKQLLTAPIRNRCGTVIGVFQLLNKRCGDFDEEDERYLAALSVHAALAVENAQHHRCALEKERQDREIDLVRRIQRAYLPERMSTNLGALDVAAMNLLCEDASGDFYDVIELANRRLLIAVGDVAGHGLGAALVMAQARAFLRAFTATVRDLPTVMNLINDNLARDMHEGRFMSLFVAISDPRTGHLEWINAGHPAAFLLRAKTGHVERLTPQGRVLGAFADAYFEPAPTSVLDSDDVLLLYTDGATEARNQQDELLGEQRLATVLGRLSSRTPEEILDSVLEALVAWTGREQFSDDLTLAVVKCRATMP